MATATIASETRGPATVHAIVSARDPRARRIADVLRARSGNPRVFLIDDAENIREAVAGGVTIDSVYVSPSADLLASAAAAGHDVPHYVLGDGVARTLFGDQKRSRVFALARAPRQPRLQDLIAATGDIIVLDGVRLVGNIGAITRTACALGASGVVLVDSGLRTIFDRRLIRSSRGLVFATSVVTATRRECVEFLGEEHVTVAALSADAVEPLRSIRSVPGRLALLMGGEREGVSSELDALTTHRYAIPMSPDVESLNVSVAAGIALYEHGAAAGSAAPASENHPHSRLRRNGLW